MARMQVNGQVELEYEDMGPADAPPVLLIMGLGSQMILLTSSGKHLGLYGRSRQTKCSQYGF